MYYYIHWWSNVYRYIWVFPLLPSHASYKVLVILFLFFFSKNPFSKIYLYTHIRGARQKMKTERPVLRENEAWRNCSKDFVPYQWIIQTLTHTLFIVTNCISRRNRNRTKTRCNYEEYNATTISLRLNIAIYPPLHFLSPHQVSKLPPRHGTCWQLRKKASIIA